MDPEARIRQLEKYRALQQQHCACMSRKVSEMHRAILGDPSNGERGMCERLHQVEDKLDAEAEAKARRDRRWARFVLALAAGLALMLATEAVQWYRAGGDGANRESEGARREP